MELSYIVQTISNENISLVPDDNAEDDSNHNGNRFFSVMKSMSISQNVQTHQALTEDEGILLESSQGAIKAAQAG